MPSPPAATMSSEYSYDDQVRIGPSSIRRALCASLVLFVLLSCSSCFSRALLASLVPCVLLSMLTRLASAGPVLPLLHPDADRPRHDTTDLQCAAAEQRRREARAAHPDGLQDQGFRRRRGPAVCAEAEAAQDQEDRGGACGLGPHGLHGLPHHDHDAHRGQALESVRYSGHCRGWFSSHPLPGLECAPSESNG